MNRVLSALFVIVLLTTVLAGAAPAPDLQPQDSGSPDEPDQAGRQSPRDARSSAAEAYGKVPLHFEPNLGQFHADVAFQARAGGYTFFLTPTEAVFVVRVPSDPADADSSSAAGAEPEDPTPRSPDREAPPSLHAVRMAFVDAQPNPRITAEGERPGRSNYLLGNDPSKWATDVPHHDRILVEDLWPGIDMVFYGTPERAVQYDFIVAPGANPAHIRLAIEGATPTLEEDGALLVASHDKPLLRFPAPYTYQGADDAAVEVASAFDLHGNGAVGFRLGQYDLAERLVIDPVVAPAYSTFLGGSGHDLGSGIAVDGSGNAYVTGETYLINFPTTAGAFQTSHAGAWDVFVTKLNPSGSSLVYSTYLGGSNDERGWGIAADGSGNAYVTGSTRSINFPTTAGAFQTSNPGGFPDAFVTKLNPSGSSLVYSTYLGGSSSDNGHGIAVDGSGNAYVTGDTFSTNFPTTAGAFQTSRAGSDDTFVTKLNPSGSSLVYSTYLGGSSTDFANGIAVDGSGNAYVTGLTESSNFPTTASAFQTSRAGGFWEDAFVTKLNPSGTSLVYSTYLGGSDSDSGWGIEVDGSGNAYVTGDTFSTNFPTTAGAFQTSNAGGFGFSDVFVTKLNPSGSSLVYSTYLGGSSHDYGNGIAVDGSGNAYVIGSTYSINFPTAASAFPPSNAGGFSDAFVTKLNPSGSSLVYSTYLGGSNYDWGSDIAVDASGDAYVTGGTTSINFPTTADAFQPLKGSSDWDAFVTKLTVVGTPLYFESFEPGLAPGWVLTGLWHVSNCQSATPLHSLAYNRPLLTCPSDFDTGARTTGDAVSPPIDIPAGATSVRLNWKSWHDTESGTTYDKKIVYVTNNGGVTWTPLWQESGAQATWNFRSLDISAYAGSKVSVRFHFDSVDGFANNGEGWSVDDVSVTI